MSSPASSGASPAPSANPSGSQPQGGSGAPSPSPGGQGGGFDPTEAIREARQARQENSRLRSSFDSHSQEFNKTKETLDRVRQAFVPEERNAAPDPVADLEQQMDYYLEQAMEAKARGQAIPLTTNLALRFFQAQIENHKTQKALLDQIAELKGGVDQANDPQKSVNDFAYAQMENQIQNQLDQLYGTDPRQQGTKANVYSSVVNTIQQDLLELQEKAPHVWDKVRRNPQQLAKIVQGAVQSIVPPRALELIQNEHLQNTPMSEGELWAAWRQVDKRTDLTPVQRQQLKEDIRVDLVQVKYGSKGRRR